MNKACKIVNAGLCTKDLAARITGWEEGEFVFIRQDAIRPGADDAVLTGELRERKHLVFYTGHSRAHRQLLQLVTSSLKRGAAGVSVITAEYFTSHEAVVLEQLLHINLCIVYLTQCPPRGFCERVRLIE